MSRGQGNPSTWDQYERGDSPGRESLASNDGRHIFFEDNDLAGSSPRTEGPDGLGDHQRRRLRHRRSSMSNRISALGDVGGVNSIRSFTRSWQRAAGFAEVIPQRPSFVFAPDQAPLGAHDGIQYGRVAAGRGGDEETGTGVSLLRQHLEAEHAVRDDSSPGPSAADESRPLLLQPAAGSTGRFSSSNGSEDRERKASMDNELRRTFSLSSGTSQSIFAVPPQLAAPDIVGSYSSYRSYGTLGSAALGDPDLDLDFGLAGGGGRGGPSSSMAQAGEVWRQQQRQQQQQQQQQQQAAKGPDGETQPILVKEVEQEDGKIVLTVKGQSTLPQTIFNSTNVLIGVGLLSLPMGIKYAGWLCGMVTLAGAAVVTAYTARLLARCMDLDPSLITFSDLAYISFGRNARVAVSVLFTLELLAACVALIVLFADSMELLFGGLLSVNQWKILFSIVLIPLNFLPLRLLSFTSVIGILCCLTIVLIVIIDGFIKPDSPGSLLQPATTYLFPANWLTLPLSFGLLMSPWGGHGVFSQIYRDMRHPHKYGRAVTITFTFTYLLDAAAAVAGLLMFGDDVLDAITSNILLTAGYPKALTYLLCAVIAIIPLTKVPLNARPIIATAEVLLGVHHQGPVVDGLSQRPNYARTATKILIRVVTIFVFLVIAIVFPAFDSIMAFMGSALCFTICGTLPLAFYLKLFGNEISTKEKMLDWVLIVVCVTLSVVGTVWAFLPKSLIGAA